MKIAVYTNILRVRVLARRCAAYLEAPEVRVCAVNGMDRWEERRAAHPSCGRGDCRDTGAQSCP